MGLDSRAPAPRPEVGADEWVARQAGRRQYLPSWLGVAQRAGDRVGWWPRLALAGLAGGALPLLGLGGFQLQVGINALVYALLAVGLNIVVGWAGVLDLGYVAFFGFGAYGFALLSSAQLGMHWWALFSVPVVVIAAAILGLAVGLPSRRLIGDYLAIITLFFGEAFYEVTNNVAASKLGGANGIFGIDPIRAFGHQLVTNEDYYYLLVFLVVATMAVLRMLEHSRTGRAWQAVREDPLAAASMTIPVNRVKLTAFASGAMVAALAGTIFAAQQASVFPTDFQTQPVLIFIYAALILGGVGSIAGACAGALVVVTISDGLLRSPAYSGYLFYGLIAATVLARLRPWRRLAAVGAATVALGFAVHAVAAQISPDLVAAGPQSGGWIAGAVRYWVVVPANPQVPGNYGFVLLIGLLIALVQVKGRWRTILLVPALYLASFVWETRLVVEGAGITRQLMIGAILVVLMIARPQGLLGTRRVEALT